MQAPATAHRLPSDPGQYTWPAAVSGNWRVVEWMPNRIGTWSFEDGNALVGQVAILQPEELLVPGYVCELPSFHIADTGAFWEQFERCENGEASGDCRDIFWTGEAMFDCSGSDSVPMALAEVSATCEDKYGLPFGFLQLSATRALLSLPDGRGHLCLELMD